MLRAAARAAARAARASPAAAPRDGAVAPAWCASQRRFLNIHEYQGAELLRAAGVNVPPGIACRTVEEVAAAAAKLGGQDGEVVLKSQVLAGGRGLGSFTNGLKGGVHIVKARDAAARRAPRAARARGRSRGAPALLACTHTHKSNPNCLFG
jgi:succinyl-CoA synthetase beta subunit